MDPIIEATKLELDNCVKEFKNKRDAFNLDASVESLNSADCAKRCMLKCYYKLAANVQKQRNVLMEGIPKELLDVIEYKEPVVVEEVKEEPVVVDEVKEEVV